MFSPPSLSTKTSAIKLLLKPLKCWNAENTGTIPGNIYLFKVNNRNTRKRCKKCLS